MELDDLTIKLDIEDTLDELRDTAQRVLDKVIDTDKYVNELLVELSDLKTENTSLRLALLYYTNGRRA
ncbi:MAG: hypothetical protein NUV65_06915 [Candidatus Roizmanbacteria bacterium]|nr:hypothetical protein [Candidatus Roizmanbacteria bacterium]